MLTLLGPSSRSGTGTGFGSGYGNLFAATFLFAGHNSPAWGCILLFPSPGAGSISAPQPASSPSSLVPSQFPLLAVSLCSICLLALRLAVSVLGLFFSLSHTLTLSLCLRLCLFVLRPAALHHFFITYTPSTPSLQLESRSLN